jgi:membrane dipeptidase
MKLLFPLVLIVGLLSACSTAVINKSDSELREYSKQLADKILLIDTHLDSPMMMLEENADFSQSSPKFNFDYPRAKAGGLKVPFMAAFISSEYVNKPGAKELADKIISRIEKLGNEHKDKFQLVSSSKDVVDNYTNGKILLAMGIENGVAIEDDLKNIKYFYDKGVRYITLTHSKYNKICDSSFDPNKRWNGLSPFGVEVVKEMNRVGMIIDVSHVSDSTFYQVLRISKVPVVATHTACRYFTPGLERNMSDEMIKLLAKNGGVIQINFGSYFLTKKALDRIEKDDHTINKYIKDNKLEGNGNAIQEFVKKYYEENPKVTTDVKDVADHIDHVVKLVGIDYVGIGSDFDGLGDTLPNGLKDVSNYPNIIYELLKKGYTEEDIKKVMGGNFIRVWQKVEESVK